MKYVEKVRKVKVPLTVNGITEMVDGKETVSVPVMPRGHAAAARTFLIRFAAIVTVVSVVLSLIAITKLGFPMLGWGSLLFAAFWDGVWIWALVAEWESRYHPRDRFWARIIGVIAVLGSVAAVFLATRFYGGQHGAALAFVLAAVPAGSKGLWTWLLHRYTPRLSKPLQQHYDLTSAKVAAAVAEEEAQAELDAARALTAELRNLRGLGAVTVEQLAEPAPMVAKRTAPTPAAVADATWADAGAPDDNGEDAEPPLEPPTLASLTKAEAVRIAISKRPGYTPREIAELLGDHDVEVGEAYVRQVRNRDAAATK